MMKNTDRKLLIVLAALLVGCNLEVGNPDGDPPAGMRPAQTVSFNLQAGGACTSTTASCTSVPVTVPDASGIQLTYDMTGASFQLSSLQLKPLDAEQMFTRLDLLNGSSVTVANSTGAIDINSVAMQFSPAAGAATTFTLTGNLLISNSTGSFTVPLTLEYSNNVGAEVQLPADSGTVDTIVFDPKVWFDFSTAPHELQHILKGISDGACRTPDSPQCTKYRDNLARNISQRISRSLTVKTRAIGANQQRGASLQK